MGAVNVAHSILYKYIPCITDVIVIMLPINCIQIHLSINDWEAKKLSVNFERPTLNVFH